MCKKKHLSFLVLLAAIFTITACNAGFIKGSGDLCGESVNVNISGSGDATICATETLDSNVRGSGSVNYYGKPSINSSGSGSGTLNSLGEK